jgi:fatty-acyl-CoA synthase
MQVELNVGDFLARAALVAPDRIAVVDEPGAPGSLGALTYGSLQRRSAAVIGWRS